ncbi:Serine/threonine-protein phosphatase 7 long form-like [Senna tora]|uniref:Serine/threonine-protein phosphatase 7 long form-like n=1 Tax=Senna tora TaxID=362788 RepID=A0A834WW13_9FABA|nr:Serine/threonine-protein phosphatase 7 long form-like [Senna tora]
MPIIEICGQITGVLQDSVGGDYIPEAPLQTVVSQEFLGSQPAAGDDEYGGTITEIERLLSIPAAAPNDVIGDKEYEDHLMGNDIEDEDYEEEDPNDYEREDPYHTWTEDEDLRSGLVFADKDGVQDALKLFSLKRHVDYRVTRSAEKFIECKCVHHAKGCKWRVRASYRVDLQLWMISRYDGPHSCASTVIAKDHPKLDSDMIAGLVTEKADIPIFLVVETVKKARGFTVSYKKAWRGKQKAIARVYAYAASGRDVPVRLREHVAKDREVCLISDRGTGLLAALENPGTGWQPPLGHNVFCIRHVASNLNSKFKNRVIRALLMKAGHEYTERGCQRRLDRICLLNKDAANWIDNIPRQKWARAYDEGRRCGHMTTNLAECMNGVLKGVRCLPVTALVQATLYKLETMLVAYNQPFHPVGGEEYWPHVLGRPVMPNPQALRPPGRPRSTRIRNEMDWKELGNKPKCVAPHNRAGERLFFANSSPRDDAALVLSEKETGNLSSLDF